ncbi:MAG: membrane protein insertion efficiency factor YidD [bacterium]
MKKLLIRLIRIYQKTLSFDHGFFKFLYPHGYCRFYPSCSEYAIEALNKHGLVRGSFLAIYRILKCNPFNKGGFDPLK